MDETEPPDEARELLDQAVAFVVVLDLMQAYQSVTMTGAVQESMEQHQRGVTKLTRAYPQLKPTTEGFNPAVVVREKFRESGVLDRYPALHEPLDAIEEFCEEGDPIELAPTEEDGDRWSTGGRQ